MNKKQALKKIAQRWAGCTACPIHKDRKRGKDIIFGSGNPDADFLLIGTHPTENDEIRGASYAGEEGALLDYILNEVEIDPDDVYGTYALACRPKMTVPETEFNKSKVTNRKPERDELTTCRPRVHDIIYAVDPRIIITLGLTPLQILGCRDDNNSLPRNIAKSQGTLFSTRIPGKLVEIRYPVMSALSLGAILMDPSGAKHGPLHVTLEAFLKSKQYVDFVKALEGNIDGTSD